MNWMRLKMPWTAAASVFTVSVLARPGHAFHQEVPLGEQRDQHALQEVVLAHDDLLHLVEDLLHRAAPDRSAGNRASSGSSVSCMIR